MKKKPNNQKKEIWYPVTNQRDTLRLLRSTALGWLEVENIDSRLMTATEVDLLGFINRACRAVYLAQEKRYNKKI